MRKIGFAVITVLMLSTVKEVWAIANPASEYCVSKGYRSEIVNNSDGSQGGKCVFSDGKYCEEWAFYRGQCTVSCYQPPMPTCPAGMQCVQMMPPEECTVTNVTPTTTVTPTLTSTPKKTCQVDADCASNESCYQPPMPTCPVGMQCVQMMPEKECILINLTPTVTVLGDANKDGKVDLVDFSIWKNEYVARNTAQPSGTSVVLAPTADFNNDGQVNLVDFSIWKKEYLGL